MKVGRLFEDPFAKPWTTHLARQAALQFQQELLDIDDELNIEMVPTRIMTLNDAIRNNGMPASFAEFMLRLTGSLERDLLIYYSATRPQTFMLYDVDTDHATSDMHAMYDHIKKRIEQSKKEGLGQHVNEALSEEQAAIPGASTIMARFAAELVSHGFEAEVKSSSKPGIINSSKQCIEVKGYGMKDSLKLYKPLWAHEKGMIAFVDVKTERRFSTVAEMVAALKERYPKLPQCLSYFPPPVKKKKLKESVGRALTIRQRILKLQAELIDELPDEADVGDLIAVKAKSRFGGTKFDRYVVPVKFNDDAYLIAIDSHDQMEINGVKREADAVPLVLAAVAKSIVSYEETVAMDYSHGLPYSHINILYTNDDSISGEQVAIDYAAFWLKRHLETINTQ